MFINEKRKINYIRFAYGVVVVQRVIATTNKYELTSENLLAEHCRCEVQVKITNFIGTEGFKKEKRIV